MWRLSNNHDMYSQYGGSVKNSTPPTLLHFTMYALPRHILLLVVFGALSEKKTCHHYDKQNVMVHLPVRF